MCASPSAAHAALVIFLAWSLTPSLAINVSSTTVQISRCHHLTPPPDGSKWTNQCWYLHDNRKTLNIFCPIGFKPASSSNQTVCYRRKDPENFSDFYKDCSRNIFSAELYRQLDIDKSEEVWSEYGNRFPGGPFFDMWSHDTLYLMLEQKYSVTYRNQSLTMEKKLCLVLENVLMQMKVYTAVRCDEKHYRYCFVEPMEVDKDEEVKKECKQLKGSLSFSSPVPTCLTTLNLRPNGVTLYENSRMEGFCKEQGGTLLNRGWIYVNHPQFGRKNYPIATVPADYFLSTISNDAEVPTSNRNYATLMYDEQRVNEFQGTYSNIICERTIDRRNPDLKLKVNHEVEFTFIYIESPGDFGAKNYVCFNDYFNFEGRLDLEGRLLLYTSARPNFEPTRSGLLLDKTKGDRYIWCTYRDSIFKEKIETNKVLIISNKTSLQYVYAVKFQTFTAYDSNTLHMLHKKWIQELTFILDVFKDQVNSDLSAAKLKRLYLDRKTVLYHIEMRSTKLKKIMYDYKLMPLKLTNAIKLLYVRSVYYCEESQTEHAGTVPRTPMNGNVTAGCTTYTCAGDYNEGVYWLKTSNESCKERSRLEKVTDKMKELVNSSVFMDNIATVFPKVGIRAIVRAIRVNDILEEKKGLENSGLLLNLLDRLASIVKLHGTKTVDKVISTNIALLVADTKPKSQIRGLKILANNDSGFQYDSFELITHKPNVALDLEVNSKTHDVVVILPVSVAESEARISFIAFRNDSAFRSSRSDHRHSGHLDTVVNSRVISINIRNRTRFEKGEMIEIYFSRIRKTIARNEKQVCAYWHFAGDDTGSGFWSEDGCILRLASRSDMLDICHCSHLTHFALILIPIAVFSKTNEAILEIVSIVGCCLSILGLSSVVLIAATFRTWRQEFNNKIWLQLCISVLFMSICFLIIVYAKFDHDSIGCMFIGIALHYSVLCSFCWMLVVAVISYRRLVLVYSIDFPRKLLKASAFSYGMPCITVGTLLAVDWHSYARRFEEKNPLGLFCYPSGLGYWLAVYMPIAVTLLVNCILFGLIVRTVFASRGLRHGDNNETMKCFSISCVLVVLFGLPWFIGLVAFNIVAAYVFNVLATFQGFILFLFFIFGKRDTRNMWFNKFKKKTSSKVNSAHSTSTNIFSSNRKI